MDNTTDLHPEDKTYQWYINYEWLQAHGPPTSENVLDYFSYSQFFDKQSNNATVAMQTQYSAALSAEARAQALRRSTGIEFALVHVTPPSLFIIHKRIRKSPEETKPIAAYFVMHNRVYLAPDLYSVLSAKMNASLHVLQTTLDKLSARRPDYTPRTGFAWPIVESSEDARKRNAAERRDTSVAPPDATPAETQPEKDKTAGADAKDAVKQSNFALLFNAMATTARHSERLAQGQADQAKALPASVAPTPAPAATPAPAPGTPAPTDSQQQNAVVKKKKKRMSTAAPPA